MKIVTHIWKVVNFNFISFIISDFEKLNRHFLESMDEFYTSEVELAKKSAGCTHKTISNY